MSGLFGGQSLFDDDFDASSFDGDFSLESSTSNGASSGGNVRESVGTAIAADGAGAGVEDLFAAPLSLGEKKRLQLQQRQQQQRRAQQQQLQQQAKARRLAQKNSRSGMADAATDVLPSSLTSKASTASHPSSRSATLGTSSAGSTGKEGSGKRALRGSSGKVKTASSAASGTVLVGARAPADGSLPSTNPFSFLNATQRSSPDHLAPVASTSASSPPVTPAASSTSMPTVHTSSTKATAQQLRSMQHSGSATTLRSTSPTLASSADARLPGAKRQNDDSLDQQDLNPFSFFGNDSNTLESLPELSSSSSADTTDGGRSRRPATQQTSRSAHATETLGFSPLDGVSHFELPDVMPSPPGSRRTDHRTPAPPPFLEDHASASSATSQAQKQMAALQARLGKSIIELEQAQETQNDLRRELKQERKLRIAAEERVRQAQQFEAERRTQEAAETQALNEMMHQVEGRLAASVTRAQKAEATIIRLQQELTQTKAQLASAVASASPQKSDDPLTEPGSVRALQQSTTQAAQRFRVMQSDFEAAMKLMLKHSSSFKQLASVMESMDRISFE